MTLTDLAEDQVGFPASIWQFTATWNSTFGDLTLSFGLSGHHTHTVCTYTLTDIHTYIYN